MFVLVHGSWHTGEAWIRVRRILEEAGHTTYTPTLSGMEPHTPSSPDVDLSTHIADVAGLIGDDDLHDVTLVAHSYSGFVIQGVADRLPDRIARLVYLDAFIPESGESLFDLLGPESEAGMRSTLVDAAGRTKATGADEVWLLPAADPEFYLGEHASDEDVAWLGARLVYKPVGTFAEKLHMIDQQRVRDLPAAFIRCTQFPYMEPSAAKAAALGWPIIEIDAGHDAMVTEPAHVAAALMELSRSNPTD